MIAIIICVAVAIGYYVRRKRQNQHMGRNSNPAEPVYELPVSSVKPGSMELKDVTAQEPRDISSSVAMETKYTCLSNPIVVHEQDAYQSLSKAPSNHNIRDANVPKQDDQGMTSGGVYQSLNVQSNDKNDKRNTTYQSLARAGQQPRDRDIEGVESVAMENHYMGLSNPDNNVYQPLNKERVSKDQSDPNGCYGDDHGSHGDYQPLKKINDDDSYSNCVQLDHTYQSLSPKDNPGYGSESPVLYGNTSRVPVPQEDGANDSIDPAYLNVR